MSTQTQISQLEQSHAQRLLEVAARHHQELDLQTQRLRESQLESQSVLEGREKAHRQRVRGLEGQVEYLSGGLPHQIIQKHSILMSSSVLRGGRSCRR